MTVKELVEQLTWLQQPEAEVVVRYTDYEGTTYTEPVESVFGAHPRRVVVKVEEP